jgi:hypothetical protein
MPITHVLFRRGVIMEVVVSHWHLISIIVAVVLLIASYRFWLWLCGVGEAQAAKTKAVGAAEAEVIRLKIESMEAGNYAVVQVADSLAKSGVKLVPDVIAGGGSGNGGTLVDVLLAGLIRDGVRKTAN